jgi:hypothetical protein
MLPRRFDYSKHDKDHAHHYARTCDYSEDKPNNMQVALNSNPGIGISSHTH